MISVIIGMILHSFWPFTIFFNLIVYIHFRPKYKLNPDVAVIIGPIMLMFYYILDLFLVSECRFIFI